VRVCHYIASTGLGRGEAYIDLVNALCEQIEIVLLVPRGARFLPRVDGRIQVVEYRSKDSRRNPFLLYELYRQIRSVEPDIVHTHFSKATGIFHHLNRFLRLPHVATKHNPRKGKVFNRLEHVIAVSEGVRNSIEHGKATVIYNGISVTEVGDRQENRVFTIRAVGRLDKIKGFDLLIREVAKLEFDFVLEIIGEGDERDHLNRLIHDFGLTGKVKLLGFRSDIPDLLANADLQIMSSHSEGFSLAMIEGIFYSRVFISTDVGGCNEILPEKFLVRGHELARKATEVFKNYEDFVGQYSLVKEEFKPKLNILRVADRYIEYYNAI